MSPHVASQMKQLHREIILYTRCTIGAVLSGPEDSVSNGHRDLWQRGIYPFYPPSPAWDRANHKMEFREDLKALFEKVAIGGRPVTFLFNDNQVRRCTAVSRRLPASLFSWIIDMQY